MRELLWASGGKQKASRSHALQQAALVWTFYGCTMSPEQVSEFIESGKLDATPVKASKAGEENVTEDEFVTMLHRAMG